jgi:hypothetical protein
MMDLLRSMPPTGLPAWKIRSYDPDIEDFEVEYPTAEEAADTAASIMYDRGWTVERQDGPVGGDGHFVPVAIITGERRRMFHVARITSTQDACHECHKTGSHRMDCSQRRTQST